MRVENQERKAANRERNRAFVRDLKSTTPCADCGGLFHWCAMDFDHTGDVKNDHVAVLVQQGATMKRLLAEIALCELVCSNCHRVRTYERRQDG